MYLPQLKDERQKLAKCKQSGTSCEGLEKQTIWETDKLNKKVSVLRPSDYSSI